MDVQEKWDALPESTQQQLLDQYRDVNVYFDWWDYIFTTFREDMRKIGVGVHEIYFSGFWGQGDGACFDGIVHDWAKFLTACGLPHLIDVSELLEHNFEWAHRGRYYHEYSVEFDEYQLVVENPFDEDEDPLRHSAWAATYPGEGGPLVEQFDHITTFLREQMQELYSTLEQEYEHLTSDETIQEYLLDHCEDEIDSALEEHMATLAL